MELTEEKIAKAKKYNAKLFPIFKMFSWDLLFYYPINFLFLTQCKGLTASTILFGDSFYYIFKIIFQIPSVNIIEIMGKRKALILGNIFISASVLCLILGHGLSALILCNLIMAIGFSIKGICQSSILDECVASSENPRVAFSKLDARGSFLYYCLDAVTAIACGFLFIFNAYLPMFVCFILTIIAIILSFKFLPYESSSKKVKLEEVGSFKVYFKDLKTAFKSILQSDRLKALLLFSGLFAAIITVRSTLSNSLLVEIGVEEQYFGIISFFLTITSAISSKYQHIFHSKFRNKVLTYFSMIYAIAMIIAGISAIIIPTSPILFVIVIGIYAIWSGIKGPYYTLQKRYLNSFSTPSMSPKIYAACTLIESIFTTVTYLSASFLLDHLKTSFSMVMVGCIFTIAFIFTLDYMKGRIGLKPEEYKKSDIEFIEVH